MSSNNTGTINGRHKLHNNELRHQKILRNYSNALFSILLSLSMIYDRCCCLLGASNCNCRSAKTRKLLKKTYLTALCCACRHFFSSHFIRKGNFAITLVHFLLLWDKEGPCFRVIKIKQKKSFHFYPRMCTLKGKVDLLFFDEFTATCLTEDYKKKKHVSLLRQRLCRELIFQKESSFWSATLTTLFLLQYRWTSMNWKKKFEEMIFFSHFKEIFARVILHKKMLNLIYVTSAAMKSQQVPRTLSGNFR